MSEYALAVWDGSSHRAPPGGCHRGHQSWRVQGPHGKCCNRSMGPWACNKHNMVEAQLKTKTGDGMVSQAKTSN